MGHHRSLAVQSQTHGNNNKRNHHPTHLPTLSEAVTSPAIEHSPWWLLSWDTSQFNSRFSIVPA